MAQIMDPEHKQTETTTSLDVKQISKILPHDYPFLMVDRVTEVVAGQYAKAYKNVSVNEPQFQGHFPNLPIMPGVLQIEALAQLSCIVMLMMPEYQTGYIGLFTGLDNVKFRKMVVPGDQLNLEVEIQKFRFPFGKFTAKASVNGEMTSEATISFAMAKKEELEKG